VRSGARVLRDAGVASFVKLSTAGRSFEQRSGAEDMLTAIQGEPNSSSSDVGLETFSQQRLNQ